MTPEETLAFVRLVSGMRYYQNAYFKHRGDGDLAASKDHERRVDARVREILNPQPSLFGGDPQ